MTDDPDPNKLERLLSTRTVCELLDISDRGLRRWIAKGIFPPPDVRLGSRLRWKESTIRRVIEEGTQSVTLPPLTPADKAAMRKGGWKNG